MSAPQPLVFLCAYYIMGYLGCHYTKYNRGFIRYPYEAVSGSFLFPGSCARITAQKIRKQPAFSLPVKVCCNISQPASAEKTDSRLKIREAIVGLKSFCPKICKVYATPLARTPA